MGLDCVTYRLECQLDDILDVFPLILTLKEIMNNGRGVRISMYLHRGWIQTVKAITNASRMTRDGLTLRIASEATLPAMRWRIILNSMLSNSIQVLI